MKEIRGTTKDVKSKEHRKKTIENMKGNNRKKIKIRTRLLNRIFNRILSIFICITCLFPIIWCTKYDIIRK